MIEAPDRAAALRQLLSQGVAATSIEMVSSGEGKAAAKRGGDGGQLNGQSRGLERAGQAHKGGLFRRSGTRMGLDETANFIREMATALSAGLPLVPALRTMSKARKAGPQKEMITSLIDKVEHGASLADACKQHGQPFDELLINLIRAGEASGKLPEVLAQAADLLEKSLAVRRSVIGALTYPIFLLGLVVIAIIVTTTLIVPQLLKGIASSPNVKIPLPTQILMQASTLVTDYWWLLILLIGGAVLLIMRIRQNQASKLWSDGKLLKIPLLGPMLREATVARFTRTLGTLVSSGLPVLSALRLASATVTNLAMKKALLSVCEQVQSGKTIAEPLEQTNMFPPLLIQIVALGERSGRLAELLRQAAGSMEERTNLRVRVFTEALRPLLVVVISLIVGFVIAAILMALLAMTDVTGGTV
jgi:type II secretory pathway component PulF